MKTIAVVCEFNPFHAGHLYLFDRIRSVFGSDARIVCIMSGSYVQRGGPAIADKFARAEAAVRGGASLVLELPYPWSCSYAERFAEAGVSIADALGCVDFLVFGSECGDTQKLIQTAARCKSKAFADAVRSASEDPARCNLGYPALCESVYRELFAEEDATPLMNPNDTLALEYCAALARRQSRILPYAIRRIGSHGEQSDGNYISAACLRRIISDDEACRDLSSLSDSIPQFSIDILRQNEKNGKFPVLEDSLSNAVLAFLRIQPCPTGSPPDQDRGLIHRIRSTAKEVSSLQELCARCADKTHTGSRVRRLTWHLFFGTTSAEVNALPAYTQVLAFNDRGRALLHDIRKTCGIALLTKPADLTALPEPARSQAEAACRADSVFPLAYPTPGSAADLLLRAPYYQAGIDF